MSDNAKTRLITRAPTGPAAPQGPPYKDLASESDQVRLLLNFRIPHCHFCITNPQLAPLPSTLSSMPIEIAPFEETTHESCFAAARRTHPLRHYLKNPLTFLIHVLTSTPVPICTSCTACNNIGHRLHYGNENFQLLLPNGDWIRGKLDKIVEFREGEVVVRFSGAKGDKFFEAYSDLPRHIIKLNLWDSILYRLRQPSPIEFKIRNVNPLAAYRPRAHSGNEHVCEC